jgi:Fe2+ or Zn2+ uptake regulation protein
MRLEDPVAQEIIQFISENAPVRTNALVKDLKKMHPKAPGKNNGYSAAQIYRQLKWLINSGIVSKINAEEVKEYGKNETNPKASYLVLNTTDKRKVHLDHLFNTFDEQDTDDKKDTLDEFNVYASSFLLTPDRLDNLAQFFIDADEELASKLLKIFHNHQRFNKIEPSNTSDFLDILRELLRKYPTGLSKDTNFRRNLIYLLSHYQDPIIIEQIKFDLKHGLLTQYKDHYSESEAAYIIEQYSEELFECYRELRRKAKPEQRQTLLELIQSAVEKSSNPKVRGDNLSAIKSQPPSKSLKMTVGRHFGGKR